MSVCNRIPLYFIVLLFVFSAGCDGNKPSIASAKLIDKTLCDFSKGACEAEVHEIKLYLQLMPDFAPSEEPIEIRISSNKTISDVSVFLQGRDMYMGLIPVNLIGIEGGGYQGELVFGSCASGYMVWRATVRFVSQGQNFETYFDFLADVQKHR